MEALDPNSTAGSKEALEERREIGLGGLCIVDLIFSSSEGPRAIEKRLLPKFQGRPEYEDIQRREFELLSRLSHSQIPRAESLKIARAPNGLQTFIIEMQFMEGRSLWDLRSSEFFQSMQFVQRKEFAHQIVSDLVSVLLYLKQNQIVHGDICPENLLYDPEQGLSLIDFGAARYEGEVLPHAVLGHESFKAPESLASGQTSFESDIYSVAQIFKFLVQASDSQTLAELLTTEEKRWLQRLEDQRRPLSFREFSAPKSTKMFQALALLSLIFLSSTSFIEISSIRVNTLPRSLVQIHSPKQLGAYEFHTPLMDLRLAAGQYELQFFETTSNRLLKAVSVNLKSGQTLNYFKDLRNIDTLEE